jgi:hypothetical protein
MPGPALTTLGLVLAGLATAAPAGAYVTTQTYLPPAAATRPARHAAAPRAAARPVATAAWPAATPVALPPPPLPDRGQEYLDLQLARRPAAPLRPLAPAEATAMWHGYTGRIGKPPSLGGSAAGAAGGATGSQ